MTERRRPTLARLILLAGAFVLAGFVRGESSDPAPTAAFGREAVATIYPLEVRIRRLHRVRPDLLHYPLVSETYC